MPNQKGFAPIIFILVLVLLSSGIIGGSYYIKNSTHDLTGGLSSINQTASDSGKPASSQPGISQDKIVVNESLQTISKSSTSGGNPGQKDRTNKANDSLIKYDFELISKVLSCHFLKNLTYPASESEVDKGCMFATGKFPYNPYTNKPYIYQSTNEQKGYILKVELPSREIYTVTDKNYPISILSSKQKELESYIAQGEKITKINIMGNATDKITSLPSTIKNLLNLQSLMLSENAICELPSSIGELNLKWSLYLDRNCLKNLPSEVGKLTNLIGLNLGYNKLSILPPEIGRLVALQVLLINNNELVSLPKEIGQLKIINSIDVSNNKLTSIPPEIGNLTNIRSLDLSNNQLTTLPEEISKLDNRRSDKRYSFSRLKLEGNQFSEQEKQRIRELLPTIEITF